MDHRFRVEVIRQDPFPNQTTWLAMHQDYSETFVYDEQIPGERRAGEICIKRLLDGGRGHLGPYEHASIVFNVGWFPHSVMQQLRTHRVGVSFDVQSMRYTGQRIIDVANGLIDVEEVFYIRPAGYYQSRTGDKYYVDEASRKTDIAECYAAAQAYKNRVGNGYAFEHARSFLPFDFRQHFVLSANARSLMHVLDLRAKLDAQEEVRYFCELLMIRFHNWMPELAAWYSKNRYGRARLAP